MPILFAEIDPIGYVIQGGCVALLGYLIVYSFPQMMRDIKEERQRHADELRQARESAAKDRSEALQRFETVLNTIQDKQDQRNLGLITGIKEQTKELGGKLDEHTKAISAAVLSVCKAPK